MLFLKSSTSTRSLWQLLLAGVAASAIICSPSVGLAQNQSDVTGPNLSDTTGPNLSDTTGTNQSDNTAVGGEQIFRNANGEFVGLAELFEDFFDTYGEELGIDDDASLADKLRQASQSCSAQMNSGTRRFAREPGSGMQPVSLACEEFSRLVQSAQQSLNQYKQARPQSNAIDQRLW